MENFGIFFEKKLTKFSPWGFGDIRDQEIEKYYF